MIITKLTKIIMFILSCIVLFDMVQFLSVKKEYSKEEIEVAKTIAMEACGENYIGMYAVSNVIKNRSIKYNKTPFEIVSQKKQFVGFTHINRNKRFRECEEESLYLSKNILILDDVTDNALYFKTKNEKNSKWHKIKTIKIKNHEFWK